MRGKDFNAGLRGVLFEAKHCARMGQAVWLYGWLVLRQTRQEGGLGLVLGGRPVSYREIEEETGFRRKTLERWMRVLRRAGYIETAVAPAGVIVRITKAKKFPPPAGSAPQPGAAAWPATWPGRSALKTEEPVLPIEAAPPRFRGGVSGDAVQNREVAAPIDRELVEREIKGLPDPACPPRRASGSEGANQFPRPAWPGRPTQFNYAASLPRQPAFAVGRASAEKRARREELVGRELRAGAGPEVSPPRQAGRR